MRRGTGVIDGAGRVRRAGRIARRAAFAAVAAAFLPLGGCAVSLFSKETPPTDTDEARLAALETRMDAIDKASPPR